MSFNEIVLSTMAVWLLLLTVWTRIAVVEIREDLCDLSDIISSVQIRLRSAETKLKPKPGVEQPRLLEPSREFSPKSNREASWLPEPKRQPPPMSHLKDDQSSPLTSPWSAETLQTYIDPFSLPLILQQTLLADSVASSDTSFSCDTSPCDTGFSCDSSSDCGSFSSGD